MKCDELLKIPKKDGWYEDRQKGSHKLLKKQGKMRQLPSPIMEERKYQLEPVIGF